MLCPSYDTTGQQSNDPEARRNSKAEEYREVRYGEGCESQTGNVNPSILQFLVKPAISRQGGIGQIAIRNSHPLPGGVPAGRGGSHLLFKAP